MWGGGGGGGGVGLGVVLALVNTSIDVGNICSLSFLSLINNSH